MGNKLLKWLTLGLIATSSTAGASQANDLYAVRQNADFWRTDRARVLDAPLTLQKLAEATANSPDGTEKASTKAVTEEMLQLLIAEMKTDKGVQIEAILAALGAVAGFSCQMIIREEFIAKGKITEDKALIEVATKDGRKFYMGDLLNEPLVGTKPGTMSIWSLIGGAAQHLEKPLPDIQKIYENSAQTLGSPSYGRLLVDSANQPEKSPEELLQKYWNVLRNIQVMKQGSIATMHLTVAQAAQGIILQSTNVIDPTLAAQIVMQSAIDMSKTSPDRVPFAYMTTE